MSCNCNSKPKATYSHVSHSDCHCNDHHDHHHGHKRQNYRNDPLYGRVWSYVPSISSRAVFWETSETNRRLPGTPGARLNRSLGHNSARTSGQQYVPKLIGFGAYGSV